MSPAIHGDSGDVCRWIEPATCKCASKSSTRFPLEGLKRCAKQLATARESLFSPCRFRVITYGETLHVHNDRFLRIRRKRVTTHADRKVEHRNCVVGSGRREEPNAQPLPRSPVLEQYVRIDDRGLDSESKCLTLTNWKLRERTSGELLAHYRRRGTFEDRLGELSQAISPRLSSPGFVENEIQLLLSLLSYNLLSILRGELESAPAAGWDVARVQRNVLRTACASRRRAGAWSWTLPSRQSACGAT